MMATLLMKSFNEALHRGDDMFDVGSGECRIEWKADGLFVLLLGNRAFAFAVSVGVAVEWLEVDRDVKHLASNALGSEFRHCSAAGFANHLEVDEDGVEVPGNVVFRNLGVSLA